MLKDAYLLIEEDNVYDGKPEKILVIIHPKSKFKEGFCISWEKGFMLLAKMGLTGSEYNILLIIIAQMEYENICYVTQSYLSKETGISQPHISKHINRMVKLGILSKENTDRGRALRVSSIFVWKGNKDRAFKQAFLRDSENFIMPE